MSKESPGAQKRTDSEIILPRYGRCLDAELAELTRTGGDVILLALILPRGHSARPPDPDPIDRFRSTMAATRNRRALTDHHVGATGLTDREKAVAALAGQALTNQQIANRLGISSHTVNFHLRQIFRKLRIESRVQLARLVPGRPTAVVDARPR